jgi:hypothetical protein
MRRVWARASRGRACSASAHRCLPVPAMTPVGSRDQAKLQPKYVSMPGTTAGTPEFLNSKAGEILSKSPQQTSSFLFYAVGYRPHTALTCLPGVFMHPHRMDDRGSVKHLWATTGV